jgi:colicin import membrane protein
MTTEIGTDIAVIDTAALVPLKVFAPGGIDAVLADIEAKVRSTPTDISTSAGRKAVASLAYKVARSKTALDDMGKDLVSGIKEQAAKIDADRKKARDRLDALKDEVRKPLDDFEAAEAARIAAHESAIAALIEADGYGYHETAAEIAMRVDYLENLPPRDWQEFKARAEKVLGEQIASAKTALAAAQKREAEAAELERLRREDEARRTAEAERQAKEEAERIERERIEREVRIAEEARQEAARAAQVEAERVANEAAEREARIERERAQAVADAQAAEAARIAAAEKAEADRIAAALEAERREAAAAQRERNRIAAEKEAEAAAAKAREADKAHRAKINNAVMGALVLAGLSDDAAKTAVIAIAKGAVPYAFISY